MEELMILKILLEKLDRSRHTGWLEENETTLPLVTTALVRRLLVKAYNVS